MSNHLTPLDVCLTIFGGRDALETAAGAKPKGSYAWGKPSVYRQAGDLPAHVQRKLLSVLRQSHPEFEAAWLIVGATAGEVARFIDQPSSVTSEVAAE